MLRSTFHDADKSHAKPFVVEWNPNFATAVLRIVTKPNGPQAEAKLQSLLRSAVGLSTNFAVRWVAVLGPAETELFLVSHHIALDGGSMSQLSKQFFELLAIKTDSANDPVTLEMCPEPFYRAHMLEVRPDLLVTLRPQESHPLCSRVHLLTRQILMLQRHSGCASPEMCVL